MDRNCLQRRRTTSRSLILPTRRGMEVPAKQDHPLRAVTTSLLWFSMIGQPEPGQPEDDGLRNAALANRMEINYRFTIIFATWRRWSKSSMTQDHGEVNGGKSPLASDRLALRGRLFFFMACAVMALLAATATLEVFLLLFRAEDHAGMMNGGFSFAVTPENRTEIPAGFVAISHYAIWQSTLAAALLTLRLIPGLVILSGLTGLFRLYAHCMIFTAGNEVLMRRIAWALIAYALVPLITHAALYIAGMSPVAVKLELRQLDALVLDTLLFAFVNVIAFGAEIERDRAGFF
ncbi:hypothetical protein ACYJW8_06185 [Frateuria aurantia]